MMLPQMDYGWQNPEGVAENCSERQKLHSSKPGCIGRPTQLRPVAYENPRVTGAEDRDRTGDIQLGNLPNEQGSRWAKLQEQRRFTESATLTVLSRIAARSN